MSRAPGGSSGVNGSLMLAAAIQMESGPDFERNMDRAVRLVELARSRGAELIALPENFSFLRVGDVPFLTHRLDSPLVRRLRELAGRLGIYLLAGSFHEEVPGADNMFNTSLLLGPDGAILAAYRKIHLFDIELRDGHGFRESARFQAGDDAVVCATPLTTFGLSVCYDLRFPELYRRLSAAGAEVLMIPSAFTEATGKDHWEVLVRCRAIENLCYVIAPALTGQPAPKIRNWGHSLIVDPWGNVLAGAGEREAVITAEIDRAYLLEKRRQLPALDHRRLDIHPAGCPSN